MMHLKTTIDHQNSFLTPFYHLLYNHRDETEAQSFIHKLVDTMGLPQGSSVLDLACGKGRHALYLNTLGYQVTGVDLSPNSIAYAKQFENDHLHFKVHDMCEPFNKQFDAVFNLFTSFGYFEHEEDDLNTIKAIKADLNDTGFGVIDFMNSPQVIENLIAQNVDIFHRGSNDMIVNPHVSLSGELRGVGDLISVNEPPTVNVEQFYTGELIFQ